MVKYSEEHEWVDLDGNVAAIGITEYAVGQLGDIVYVDLPEVGDIFAVSDEAAVVESVKAASEIYAPVSGTVTEVNLAIVENPSLVNEDPECDGWFFKMEIENPAELNDLMDEGAYKTFIS